MNSQDKSGMTVLGRASIGGARILPALLAMLFQAVVVAAPSEVTNQQTVAREYMKPRPARTFGIEYVAKISAWPPGTAKLRVWLPVPQDSTVQRIRELTFSQPPRLTVEPKYGNRMAYWEVKAPNGNVEFTMKFLCERQEIALDLTQLARDGQDPGTAFMVFKNPDKLVLVDDELRQLSGRITAGQETTLAKARAIYDYVITKMTYDKNHPGWGQGSTRHACNVGKGNCTDFHALFNSLCRAQGIPSGFEMGLYLPYEKGKDETLSGYHCWAFFRVPGKTWVPVDCSEANRFPERRDPFFGGHTSNRVTLSTGRDLLLQPPQAADPLNYFVNPYAEADGQPVKTEKVWSYRDLE